MQVYIVPTEAGVLFESEDPKFREKYGAGLIVKPEHLFNFYRMFYGINMYALEVSSEPATFQFRYDRR